MQMLFETWQMNMPLRPFYMFCSMSFIAPSYVLRRSLQPLKYIYGTFRGLAPPPPPPPYQKATNMFVNECCILFLTFINSQTDLYLKRKSSKNISRHNSENLMKIGWNIRKLWHFGFQHILFLDQSIEYAKWDWFPALT